MKKTLDIAATVLVMLVTSRCVERIVDATVQIDGDVWVLVLLLVLLNAAIVLLSRSIMTGRHMTEKGRPGDKSVKKRSGKDEEANESNTH